MIPTTTLGTSKLLKENPNWKYINGFEDYMVSDHGEVFSCILDRKLKKFLSGTRRKYWSVGLKNESKHKHITVHRLVAIAFIPNHRVDSYTDVNHLDGDSLNNHVSNLEWCDDSINQLHAYATGLHKRPIGEINANAKFTQREVDFLRWMKFNYPQIKTKVISKFYGVSGTNINDILAFRNWRGEVKS